MRQLFGRLAAVPWGPLPLFWLTRALLGIPYREGWPLPTSVADPDPNPDPPNPYVFGPPGSGSGPLVRGMDPDPDPAPDQDPSIINPKIVRKTLIPTVF